MKLFNFICSSIQFRNSGRETYTPGTGSKHRTPHETIPLMRQSVKIHYLFKFFSVFYARLPACAYRPGAP